MATEHQPDADPGPTDPATLTPRGAARRRFTRAGVAASGVLLTLQSQPGMACEVCTTPSGYLSGGLQSFRGAKPVCAGRNARYWASHSWPTGCSKEALFTKVFACDASTSKSYGSSSQLAIIQGKSWDTYSIGKLLMASYLNVRAGISTFQTIPMLQKIWSEYQSKGYYTPTAGVRWNAAQIANYLQRTME